MWVAVRHGGMIYTNIVEEEFEVNDYFHEIRTGQSSW